MTPKGIRPRRLIRGAKRRSLEAIIGRLELLQVRTSADKVLGHHLLMAKRELAAALKHMERTDEEAR
jgi:hypothetical protein